MSQRTKVLSLYRYVLRLSKTWSNPSERTYIWNEVRSLVRSNKDISSADTIAEKIHEFETRIEIGIHYRIPYPRPINVIPGATGKNPEVVTPAYLHSYSESLGNSQKKQRTTSLPVYED